MCRSFASCPNYILIPCYRRSTKLATVGLGAEFKFASRLCASKYSKQQEQRQRCIRTTSAIS